MAVWRVVIPPERERKLRTHAGHEWLYVLSGEMRLILGEHDITMGGPKRDEMLARAPMARTVPQIFVGETYVGGSDELHALDAAGKLDALLESA